MTFTEAASEVLKREGKPLHFKKIAEIAVRDNLLDHVGKVPEDVMGGQLAAHCRLPHAERRIVVVQGGTFALAEWGIAEDPTGLDGIVEPPPEGEPAYRQRERHPIPSKDMARSTGREGNRHRRRDREEGDEKREERPRGGRRYPPPPEVAYEILSGAQRPMTLAEIATQAAERLLVPDSYVREPASLGISLTDDNRRRESAGRKPLFAVENDVVTLVAQPEPGERMAASTGSSRVAVGDVRKQALAVAKRRLRECDGATIEHLALRMLEKMGVRDVKIVRRGREHVTATGRRRLGVADVRHCIRIVRGGAEVGRRDISEARRDLIQYGAQIALLVGPGDAMREARAEACAAGQLPVLLMVGDAMVESLAEAGVGFRPVTVPEADEDLLRAAADIAGREDTARRARREERDRQREDRPASDDRPPREERAARPARPPREERPPRRERGENDGDDLAPDGDSSIEGDDTDTESENSTTSGESSSDGAPREGHEGKDDSDVKRRRRRRRRGRGGRARGDRPPRDGDSPAQAQGSAAAVTAGNDAPPAVDPPPPPPPPSGDGSAT